MIINISNKIILLCTFRLLIIMLFITYNILISSDLKLTREDKAELLIY